MHIFETEKTTGYDITHPENLRTRRRFLANTSTVEKITHGVEVVKKKIFSKEMQHWWK